MTKETSLNDDDTLDLVAEFMEQTLDVLDVDPDTSVDLKIKRGTLYGDISGDEDDVALIIGRRGQTLDAIQYLVNAIVSSESTQRSLRVELDAQGYRKRRAKQLEKDAQKAVNEVVKTGRRVELDSMTSSERKVIHQFLKDHPEVQTISSGREPNRKLAIEPSSN